MTRVGAVPHVPTRVARVELFQKLAAARELHTLGIRLSDFAA